MRTLWDEARLALYPCVAEQIWAIIMGLCPRTPPSPAWDNPLLADSPTTKPSKSGADPKGA